jgi:hypothetical protein
MSISEMLRGAMSPKKQEVRPALDSASEQPPVTGAGEYAMRDIAMAAAAAVQQWAETDDLDDGETYADRLLAMMVGIADANHDGEIGEDEQDLVGIALELAWDYLVDMGASEEDADALLNSWDAEAGERVRDLVASMLPEGEDAAYESIEKFAFGDRESLEPALDAAYRSVMVVRGGKKMRIKKRVGGTVRLSAKQKVAIRKMQMKSHSAGAQMRRAKSLRVRSKMGL